MKDMKTFKTIGMKLPMLIISLMFVGVRVYAQFPMPEQNEKGREKILQMKVAHVRDNLGLTEEENKKFLPVYEEALRKEEAMRHKQRTLMRDLKLNYTKMSDADIEKVMVEQMLLEQQMLDAKKARYEEFKKLIPLKKIIQLKIVEREFNKLLMEKIRGNRTTPPPPPPGDR